MAIQNLKSKLSLTFSGKTCRQGIVLGLVAMILLVLGSVTVLACLGPARRAALLDPAHALRPG